jgi:hypothetical protein
MSTNLTKCKANLGAAASPLDRADIEKACELLINNADCFVDSIKLYNDEVNIFLSALEVNSVSDPTKTLADLWNEDLIPIETAPESNTDLQKFYSIIDPDNLRERDRNPSALKTDALKRSLPIQIPSVIVTPLDLEAPQRAALNKFTVGTRDAKARGGATTAAVAPADALLEPSGGGLGLRGEKIYWRLQQIDKWANAATDAKDESLWRTVRNSIATLKSYWNPNTTNSIRDCGKNVAIASGLVQKVEINQGGWIAVHGSGSASQRAAAASQHINNSVLGLGAPSLVVTRDIEYKEQCILQSVIAPLSQYRRNLDLINKTAFRPLPYVTDKEKNAPLVVDGESFGFMNMLTQAPGMAEFFDMTNAEIAVAAIDEVI